MSSRSRESVTSSYIGLYENGHWEWDEIEGGLKFVSDVIKEESATEVVIVKAIPTEIDFRDNIDLMEQLHFRKKYQRKILPGEPNVITVQDIKDLAIYTAPPNLLSRMLLQILHIPTTERFIRALILYCQYYLQVADEMQFRVLSSENKIRTPMCETLEKEFKENLADLRILVAKEYCTMLLEEEFKLTGDRYRCTPENRIQVERTPFCGEQTRLCFGGVETNQIMSPHWETRLKKLSLLALPLSFGIIVKAGAGDTQKFHHMGPSKKTRSLYLKDMRLYETLLRICIQIVWLALHRRSFNQIELELNRIFKTDLFNAVEHRLNTGFISKMTKEERRTLIGTCLRRIGKLNVRSPLLYEVFCERKIDYEIFGVGVVKQEFLNPRLQFMLMALCSPEEELENAGISLGILGQESSKYDTMLHILPETPPPDTTSSKPKWVSSTLIHKPSKASVSGVGSTRSSTSSTYSQKEKKLPASHVYPYAPIELPPKERKYRSKLPFELSEEVLPQRPVNVVQYKRWMKRLIKVQSKRQLTRK